MDSVKRSRLTFEVGFICFIMVNIEEIISAINAKSDEYDKMQKELMNKGDVDGAIELAAKKTGLWEAVLIILKLN